MMEQTIYRLKLGSNVLFILFCFVLFYFYDTFFLFFFFKLMVEFSKKLRPRDNKDNQLSMWWTFKDVLAWRGAYKVSWL